MSSSVTFTDLAILIVKSLARMTSCKHKAMAENDHVIDIFTSEDMENISLCIFRYLTLYYIINIYILYLNIYIYIYI